MVIFTKNYLSGLGRDQSNLWENILLNWIEQNWNVPECPKYDPVTAKHGVLFGTDYYGQWDFVASALMRDNKGIASELMSSGGRHEKHGFNINFYFTCRKYSGQQGDEIPVEVSYVQKFVEDLIDQNPRGLKNEGILNMSLMNISDGELEIYGQQVYEMNFTIRCIVSRINLE